MVGIRLLRMRYRMSDHWNKFQWRMSEVLRRAFHNYVIITDILPVRSQTLLM